MIIFQIYLKKNKVRIDIVMQTFYRHYYNVRAVISQNGVLERSSKSWFSEPSPVRGDR